MAPSPFIVEWVTRCRSSFEGSDAGRSSFGVPRALDIAMGRGRHALVLARAGFKTFGVDARLDAVRDAVAAVANEGRTLSAWCADLTQFPLPTARFDLVVVTRYLQRDLFPSLRATLAPGGVILYETFTTAQRRHGRGPTSPHHLLEPGELRRLLDGLEVLADEEVEAPDALARAAARRSSSARDSRISSSR
jgi:SAM-dependent methyltransferase